MVGVVLFPMMYLKIEQRRVQTPSVMEMKALEDHQEYVRQKSLR